jgi:hypothetical protein
VNLALQLLLAPILGRERVYSRVLHHLVSLRARDHEHRHACTLAVKKWRLNWENGSRASCIADYDYLVALVRESALSSNASNNKAIDKSVQLSLELAAILRDDANFRIDGRMMTINAVSSYAMKLSELMSTLQSL